MQFTYTYKVSIVNVHIWSLCPDDTTPPPRKQVGLGLHRAYIFTKQDLHSYLVHFSTHAQYHPVSIKSYIFFCVYQHKIVYVLVPLWYFKAPFVVVPGKEIVKACKDGNGKKPHEICSHLSLRLSIFASQIGVEKDWSGFLLVWAKISID